MKYEKGTVLHTVLKNVNDVYDIKFVPRVHDKKGLLVWGKPRKSSAGRLDEYFSIGVAQQIITQLDVLRPMTFERLSIEGKVTFNVKNSQGE